MFHKGDRVVYPHHGAAVIEDLQEREILGKRRTYFVLRLAHGDLTLMVPVDNTQEVGLRALPVLRHVLGPRTARVVGCCGIVMENTRGLVFLNMTGAARLT